jgi:hypothetical protein
MDKIIYFLNYFVCANCNNVKTYHSVLLSLEEEFEILIDYSGTRTYLLLELTQPQTLSSGPWKSCCKIWYQ